MIIRNPNIEGPIICPSKDNALLTRLIVEYNFSFRVDSRLQSAGIKTIEELVQKTENDLLRIRNPGKKCIKEIEGIVSHY